MELDYKNLRIGNLIINQFKKLNGFSEYIDKVVSLAEYGECNVWSEPFDKENGGSKCMLWEGIPLTEEWLTRRLGFKPDNYGTFYIPISKDQDLWVKHYKDGDNEGWSVSINFGKNMQQIIDTNFVHSLQNLYYALTNEELG